MRYYVDTSVWRDYFEDRKDNIRPLGEFAFQFLKRCQRRKDTVIVSDHVVKELLTHYSKERVEQVFSSFKDMILWINPTKEERAEAYSLWIGTKKRFPPQDILHSIIARNHNALLVSRDQHFRNIGIAECLLPEEVD